MGLVFWVGGPVGGFSSAQVCAVKVGDGLEEVSAFQGS